MRGKSNGPGMTITQYAETREISKWRAGVHRDLSNFPDPIEVGDGVRALRYYDPAELDEYFKAQDEFELKISENPGPALPLAGGGRPKAPPDSLAHQFIFSWTEGTEPGQIVEDD